MAVSTLDVVRFVVRSTMRNGSLILNTWDAFVNLAGTPNSEVKLLQDAASILWTNFYSQLRPHLSTVLSFIDISGENLTKSLPLGSFALPPVWNTGGNAGSALPPGAAALVTWHPPRQRCVAKKFVAGVSENVTNDGDLATQILGPMAVAGALMTGVKAATGTNPYNLVFGVAGQPPGDSNAFLALSNPGASSQVAYQRRRKYGVGV